jgi:uncharacterized protein YdhG (YjbR/CyaY superfamily)
MGQWYESRVVQKPGSVDEYLATMPAATREKLESLRATIRDAAPEATEKIGYGIPTFVFHGNLVHFAVYEHHIGFYPGSSPIRHFADELEAYETAKGTIFVTVVPSPMTAGVAGSCTLRLRRARRLPSTPCGMNKMTTISTAPKTALPATARSLAVNA